VIKRRAIPLIGALAVLAAPLAGVHTASAASSTWTEAATTGPSADTLVAMAYDQATSSDVLFTASGQTWTWNGTAWAQQSPLHAPSPRVRASIGYDVAHGTVVLFGGCPQTPCTTYLDDTWTWNGTDWTQQAPTLSPPARGGAAMAWDNAAGRLMLFGGYMGFGVFFGDTWAWSGTTWTELTANFVTVAAGPSPRAFAQMADDEANNSVVLFGGGDVNGALGDTWVWDDSSLPGAEPGHWTLKSPQTSPPARAQGGMAYSPAAGAPVLFGGLDTTSFGDTWTWDGADWVQQSTTGQPAVRSGQAMATGPNGDAVMFGGAAATLLGDTWSWTGSATPYPLSAPTIESCPGTTTALPTTTSGPGTLRGAAAVGHPGFSIGSGLPGWQTWSTNPVEESTDASQFNIITSTNQMTWSGDEPQQGVFDFCDGDQFVGLAKAYHQTLFMHLLVTAGALAGGQNPNWVNTPTIPWTPTTLEAVMQQYITTVVQHYHAAGVTMYSVVGEALQGDGSQAVNVFQKVIGYPKYVELAFQYAHQADPNALLLYDDFGDYGGNAKESAVRTLMSDVIASGVPASNLAAGMELFDFTGGAGSVTMLESTMSNYASLGIRTGITQMTVPLPSATPTAGDLSAQADTYGAATQACLAAASNCFMLMTWGDSDTLSLVTNVFAQAEGGFTTGYGGALFDEKYQPRPAFYTVLADLG